MHAPGYLREAFEGWVLDGQIATEIGAGLFDEGPRPVGWLLGRLAHCSDIMPRNLCESLDMPQGSTYAAAVQVQRAGGREPAPVPPVEELSVITLDDAGVEVELRFAGRKIDNSGIYITAAGDAVLVTDQWYEKWPAEQIADDPDGFEKAVVASLEEGGVDSEDGLANILHEFGVRPVINL